MMRVALVRNLAEENWASIEVYSDQLSRTLREATNEIEFIDVRMPAWKFPKWRVPTFYGRGASVYALGLYLSRWIRYPLTLRNVKADVYHILDNSYGHLAFFLKGRRTVITYHGGGSGLPQRIKEWNPSGPAMVLYWLAFQGMLQCQRIISVSEFGKQELVTATQFPANRIQVAHHGIAKSFRPLTDRERVEIRSRLLRSGNRFLVLHVGNNDRRKNTSALYCALHHLRLNHCQAQLVCIGSEQTQEQARLIDELGIRDHIVYLPRIANAELHSYYAVADVFVFPSLYEGFGLPVLEAMASGAPVICANTSSLPEIVGDAARLTEPNELANLADTIRSVLEDGALAADLRERGFKRAKMFTWERCAQETLKVYRQIQ